LTQIELDQLNGNTIELDQLNKTELEDLNWIELDLDFYIPFVLSSTQLKMNWTNSITMAQIELDQMITVKQDLFPGITVSKKNVLLTIYNLSFLTVLFYYQF